MRWGLKWEHDVDVLGLHLSRIPSQFCFSDATFQPRKKNILTFTREGRSTFGLASLELPWTAKTFSEGKQKTALKRV